MGDQNESRESVSPAVVIIGPRQAGKRGAAAIPTHLAGVGGRIASLRRRPGM
jgi:hypothetical protein